MYFSTQGKGHTAWRDPFIFIFVFRSAQIIVNEILNGIVDASLLCGNHRGDRAAADLIAQLGHKVKSKSGIRT